MKLLERIEAAKAKAQPKPVERKPEWVRRMNIGHVPQGISGSSSR